jgi:hypothetical protein
MATLVSKYSLLEQAKRIDPNGSQAQIAEILNFENEMLYDAPWLPSNDIWTNKTTRRALLPNGTWRKLNSGVATEVAKVDEILDVIGMLETYSETDKEYIDNMPDPRQARMDEAQAFIEGLGQTLGSAMLYGNSSVTPEEMTGFAPRLNTVDSQYIFDAGGSGTDTTSIYIVTWGRTKVYMIYPKNSVAQLGVKHADLGQVTIAGTNVTTVLHSTNQYEGYRDHFQVKCGLVVKDPRCIGRIANIEVTGTSNIFDEDDLIKCLNRMKTNADTRMYVNDSVLSQMQIALKDKNNVNYTPGQGNGLSGEPPIYFQGVPVRKIAREILINTEVEVT